MAHWQHNKRTKTDTTQEPIAGAFFSNETVGNLSTALIREGIQNNLDEIKNTSEPVKVKIFLSGIKYALSTSIYIPLIERLIPHLQAENNGIIKSSMPNLQDPMPYLLFEDFNTKGLEGNVDEFMFNETRDKARPHNFYYFWRAYGISGKSGKMGSWGVGKSVFPAVSRINSFWGLTVRASDEKAFLMGQSVLKTHDLINEPADCGYFPYGYYAKFEDNFALPEDDAGLISEFSKNFKFERKLNTSLTSNTGLSVLIPFPKEEVNLHSLTFSTIQQFIYPILHGKLEVAIQEEDQTIHLSKNGIRGAIKTIDWSRIPLVNPDTTRNLLSLCDFIEWSIDLKKEEYTELQFKNPSSAYEWRKNELFANVQIEKLQDRFDDNEPLAFTIPVKFQPENEQPQLRFFNAYIQKDDSLEEPESYFIRDSLTITGIKSLKRKGVRGLVVLSDKDLITFFGQAEGPAHTGWHKDNFRVRYENAEGIISFVQRSLEKLYSYLLIPAIGIDKSLLKDFFSISDPDDVEARSSGKKPGKKDDKPLIPPIETSVKLYYISKSEDGFKITSNQEVEEFSTEMKIKVAYLRTEGNKTSFKKYSEFDFNLKAMQVSSKNIKIIRQEKNVLELEVLDKDYEIEVSGFDKRRDLIVDIN